MREKAAAPPRKQAMRRSSSFFQTTGGQGRSRKAYLSSRRASPTPVIRKPLVELARCRAVSKTAMTTDRTFCTAAPFCASCQSHPGEGG